MPEVTIVKRGFGHAFIFLVSLLFSLLLITACKGKKVEHAVIKAEQINANKYSFIVNNVEYTYSIDFPKVVENSALVIMVHGMNNTGERMKLDTHFDESANLRGYTVVYVTIAQNSGSIYGWNSGIAGQGNDDVLFLRRLAEYLEKEYSLDKKRTFAVGFSNGAFMMHRLAMEAADVFEACVSVAGKMPHNVWNNRNKKNHIGFFQITGEKDEVTPKRSDKGASYSYDPLIEDVMDYWAESNGLTVVSMEEIGKGSGLTKWSGKAASKKAQVWHLLVKNGHHLWAEEELTGINTNELILDFFDLW